MVLKRLGYVDIDKGYEGKRPRTWVPHHVKAKPRTSPAAHASRTICTTRFASG